MDEYMALLDAHVLLSRLMQETDPLPVWRKLDHARSYLLRDIERLLSEVECS